MLPHKPRGPDAEQLLKPHQGHRRYEFIWTADVGMVEMPSLGRFEAVDVASSNGLFAGFTIDTKTNALHAVLWAPSPLHPRDRVSLHRLNHKSLVEAVNLGDAERGLTLTRDGRDVLPVRRVRFESWSSSRSRLAPA